MSRIIVFKISTGQQTRAEICAKIVQIDAIIASLYTTALISVGNGDIARYEIDTGQSRQEVEYTKLDQVTKAIENYEKIRQMLQNKLSPRTFRLMDSKNFRHTR